MAERWTRKHRGHWALPTSQTQHSQQHPLHPARLSFTQLIDKTLLNKSECQLQEVYTSFYTQYSFTIPKEILSCLILDVQSHLDTWMLCSNNSSRTQGDSKPRKTFQSTAQFPLMSPTQEATNWHQWLSTFCFDLLANKSTLWNVCRMPR